MPELATGLSVAFSLSLKKSRPLLSKYLAIISRSCYDSFNIVKILYLLRPNVKE